MESAILVLALHQVAMEGDPTVEMLRLYNVRRIRSFHHILILERVLWRFSVAYMHARTHRNENGVLTWPVAAGRGGCQVHIITGFNNNRV